MEVNVQLSSKVAGAINVDDTLSTLSDNAIANKAVATEIERINDNIVEKDRLEKAVFKMTLDDNLFETTNGTADISISGIVTSSIQQLIVNESGNPVMQPKDITPESVNVVVKDFEGNLIEDIKPKLLQPKTAFSTSKSYTVPSSKRSGISGSANATIKYNGRTYEVSQGFYIEYPRYFGAISATEKISANTIIHLGTKTVSTNNDYVGVQGVNNQRTTYAFPKYMGELTSIFDATNFDIISGFDKSIINVNGIDYLCYVERIPVTATSLTYKFK